MFWTLLVTFLSSIFAPFVYLLPVGAVLNSSIVSALAWAVSSSMVWNYIFPVTTVWSVMLFFVPILVAYFLWSGIMFVLGFIRGNYIVF